MALRYFFVSLIVKLVLVAGQPQPVHYVLKGREAILTPSLTKIPDDILWKHNGDKVIIFDGAQESVYGDYKGRVTLAWDTAELTISDVKYEDSGEYELDALIRNRLHRTQYMLKVLDKVSKPVITCLISDESSSNKTSGLWATLTCSSESNTPEALTYKWNLDEKHQLGQALTIPLGNDHDEIEYSCTATNPLHAETTIYLAKDCHTEALNVGLIVPIVIALLILIAFGAMFFILRHQRSKKMCCTKGENNDLEKQIKAAMRNADEPERKPLMNLHRQETFPSQQRLPQTDNVANVRETPQKQEIRRDMKVLQVAGNVKKNKENFEKAGQTDEDYEDALESQSPSSLQSTQPTIVQDSELQPEVPQPQTSDSTVNQDSQSKQKEDDSKGQADSEGNPDMSHSGDHPQKPESSTAPKQTESLSEPTPPSSAPDESPVLRSGSGEKKNKDDTALNGASVDDAPTTDDSRSIEPPEPASLSPTSPQHTTMDQGSELQPSEHQSKKLRKSEEQPDVDHSDDNKLKTEEAGVSGSTELKEESTKKSSKTSEEVPQTSVSTVDQDSQSKPKEDESKGQADSEENPDMGHSDDNPQKQESSTAPKQTGPVKVEGKEQKDSDNQTNKDSTEDNGPQKDRSSINSEETVEPDVKPTPADSVPGSE